MKKISLIIFFLLTNLSFARVLETLHFEINVQCQAPQYEVGCNSVTYYGKNKDNGHTIQLQGKQIMQMCKDGVTPCHSLGYEFYNGSVRYLLTEGGQLVVSQGKNLLFKEDGVWSED